MLTALLKIGVRVNGVAFKPSQSTLGERTEARAADGMARRHAATRVRQQRAGERVPQSIVDLAALRITGDLLGEHYVLPAAGLPWFMTLFGRDTLITSFQTLWARAGARARCAPPAGRASGDGGRPLPRRGTGRIMHEVRSGELTQLGEKPHSPYYGTADATPLWLILLSDYWRITGDDAFVLARRRNVRPRSAGSTTATATATGTSSTRRDRRGGSAIRAGRTPGTASSSRTARSHLPIATAEIQGYVFDAKRRVAEFARKLIDDASSPNGSSWRPTSSTAGSRRTSGRTSTTATTSSGSTATSAGSTR